MGLTPHRRGSVIVEAVGGSRDAILRGDANALRGQIIMLSHGSDDSDGRRDVTGLLLADVSVANGADVAGP